MSNPVTYIYKTFSIRYIIQEGNKSWTYIITMQHANPNINQILISYNFTLITGWNSVSEGQCLLCRGKGGVLSNKGKNASAFKNMRNGGGSLSVCWTHWPYIHKTGNILGITRSECSSVQQSISNHGGGRKVACPFTVNPSARQSWMMRNRIWSKRTARTNKHEHK